MAAFFLDSSSLVKRFADESGTRFVVELFRERPANLIFVSRITSVEVSSALIRKAYANEITIESEQRAAKRLQRVFKQKLIAVEITESLMVEAVQLARKFRLRGYDAVQLASALVISTPVIFVSADSDLNRAALAEGLIVENPNNH